MTEYPKPAHPILADFLARIDDTTRECYEERAGILQYDAGLVRPLAEALALLEVIRYTGWPPRQSSTAAISPPYSEGSNPDPYPTMKGNSP